MDPNTDLCTEPTLDCLNQEKGENHIKNLKDSDEISDLGSVGDDLTLF